ncbi:DUF445 domain-containing protein [Aquilutibacter rugosus]|uniref:DUF445 domain-containing protein n=1 Tax=Aquilutibacter rugosus TaxID=3115820 RepID=UPI002F4256CC
MSDPVQDRRAEKARQLRQKKRTALLMLVFAAALFVVGSLLQGRVSHWSVGLLIAMSEAAMIGGLADWFAVVALFRHPMGQRWIPHTAIIPAKKDAIGSNLAHFISDHFLGTEQVIAKLRDLQPAERLSRYVNDPQANARLGDLSLRVFPHLVRLLDSPQLHHFVQRTAIDRLARLDIATVAAQALELLTRDRRHAGLLDNVLVFLHSKLESDELRQEITARVGDSMWKILKWAQVDDLVADRITERILNALRTLLAEMIEDPEHPMRQRIDDEMLAFVERLRHDGDTRAHIEQLRDTLLANPALADYLQGLWRQFLQWIETDTALGTKSTLREHVVRTVSAFGSNLAEDAAMRQWLDTQIEALVDPALGRYRESIRRFIVERVERWPADELTSELELSIGADLQYVRYNGTVIGALIGGVLYGLMKWLESLSGL